MIYPYDWPDQRFILTVRNASNSYSFLVDQVSQEEFIEYWFNYMDSVGRPDRKKILEMQITPISAEVFEMMRPYYGGEFLLEG